MIDGRPVTGRQVPEEKPRQENMAAPAGGWLARTVDQLQEEEALDEEVIN